MLNANRLNWPKCTQITKQQRNNDHAFIRILIIPMHKRGEGRRMRNRERERQQRQENLGRMRFDALCECTALFILFEWHATGNYFCFQTSKSIEWKRKFFVRPNVANEVQSSVYHNKMNYRYCLVSVMCNGPRRWQISVWLFLSSNLLTVLRDEYQFSIKWMWREKQMPSHTQIIVNIYRFCAESKRERGRCVCVCLFVLTVRGEILWLLFNLLSARHQKTPAEPTVVNRKFLCTPSNYFIYCHRLRPEKKFLNEGESSTVKNVYFACNSTIPAAE